MSATIVIGVDGSDPSRRAVEWCAEHARAFDAEVVAVHALEVPTYVGAGPPYIWLASGTPEQRDAWRDLAERDWCKPLADAGVPFRVTVRDGDPASALMEESEDEDAALVVVGRHRARRIQETPARQHEPSSVTSPRPPDGDRAVSRGGSAASTPRYPMVPRGRLLPRTSSRVGPVERRASLESA